MNTKNPKTKIRPTKSTRASDSVVLDSRLLDDRVLNGGVNIFKTLGRPDADEAFAKVELAYQIHALIEQMGLSQTQAAKRLGTDRARVSNLMRGRLKEFSIGRLFHFLTQLGQDVDVTVHPKRREQAQVHILARAG
jgi:predicted XRE-type DNA-binding protein